MIVRAKTKRRLMFLIAGTLLAIAVLTTAVLVLKHRRTQYYLGQRETGMAAYKSADYLTAINSLATYIGRYKQDAEAIQTLAEAQKRVESPDDRNLRVAVRLYRQLVQLSPTRQDYKRELALLYSRLGQSQEVIDLGRTLLEYRPDDVQILVARAKALAMLRDYKQALADSELAIKHAPLDVEAQAVTMELYGQLDRKNEILPHAQKLVDAYPRDGRTELLMGIACLLSDPFAEQQQKSIAKLIADKYPDANGKYPELKLDTATATARAAAAMFIREAAVRPVTGVMHGRYLAAQLDRLSMPMAAADVLDRALRSQTQDEPALRRVLVRRLFEIGRYAEVEKRLANLQIRPAGATDSEMLGLKAIALAAMNRAAEATTIADQLEALPNDRIARAWSVILKQTVIKAGDTVQVIEAVRPALEVQKFNPYLRYYLGAAYEALGERDLAIESFKQVVAVTPLWHLPLMHLSRLFLEDNQPALAREAAQVAAELTRRVIDYINLASIWAASMSREDLMRSPDLPKLAELLTLVQSKMPGEERTLPMYIVLLAKSGKQAEAEKALRDALESKNKPSESLLVKLAIASREAGLAQDEACFALAEKLYGLTPDVAMARARQLLVAGKAAEGATYLETALQKHAADATRKTEWRMAWVRYLEDAKDPRAAAVWKALGDDPELKANLVVQRTILSVSSAQTDRQLVMRTIDRIRAITGEQAVGWRIARARAISRGDATRAELEEAAKLMNEVVTTVPSNPEARHALALVQEQLGNTALGIEQLLAAIKLKPQSDAMVLDLARMYYAQSDFAHAREQMGRIKPDQLKDDLQRRQLAWLWSQQGETARAAEILETMGGPTTNPTAKLMLADLYRRRNQAARAEKLYAELLKTPTAPAVAAAAAFYASTGRAADADAALQRLSDIKNLEPGAKELVLAEHYATYGKPEQATEQYKAAVKAAPGNANIWRSFLVYCVRAGRIDEALANAEEATKACPANKTFANFSALAKELKLVAAERAFVPLIVSVLQSSTDSETAAAVIRIGAEALQAKQTPAALAAKLRPLADRAPNLVGLQALLIQSYMLADRLDEAAAIAQRSAKASPASAEIAQLAAKVLAASGDYRQAIVAASRWRELSLNDPLAADLFIAAMHLRLNDVAAASSQIMPHLESARAKPDAYRDVLLIQARILMKQGQASEADKLIWPYVTNTSPEWRKAWLDLVLSINSSPSLAAEWLDRVEKVIPESSVDERVMLAQLWQELGRQANSNEYKQKAKTILTQLSAQSGKSAQVLFTSGALEENSGNLKEAEKLYRQAIEVQPSFPAAQNNLAMVIMSLDGDLVEAAALAAKAVQAAPQVAAFHDTLAQIQAKSKDYKSAIATITKATQLEPANPAWQINLATIYDSAGDRDGLDRTLRQIDLLVRGKQLTPEYDAELKRLRARATTRSATTKPTI